MKLKKKAVYLKGLMEGLELDKSSREGKALLAMYDLLNDLCKAVAELDHDLDQVYEELDAIDEDMDDLEDAVFGDEDEDDEPEEELHYELTCPNCGAVTEVDEDTLFSEDISCANCGAEFDIEFTEVDDEDEDEEEPEEEK